MPEIETLPKWAQQKFRQLERQRDVAVLTLNKWRDSQTPSPIYVDDNPCTGEKKGPVQKRHYIQAYKVNVDHAGVELEILLRDNQIDMSWHSSGIRTMSEVALVPEAYQKCRLVSRENMRK